MTQARLHRILFALSSAPARFRFRRGRASFVECVIARSDRDLRQVRDHHGLSLGPKWLARYVLSCRPPQTNSDGWTLYSDLLGSPGRERLTELECANCGHRYVIQVTDQKGRFDSAPAADFESEWFRFSPSRFDGPRSLKCLNCDVRTSPKVTHLREP